MRKITGLFIYPIKSLQGIAVEAAPLNARGLAFDRAWMLVDPTGRFLTQRELPRMARLAPELGYDGLKVSSPDAGPLVVPIDGWSMGRRLRVGIWDNECDAVDQGDDAARWFGSALSTECRLVKLPNSSVRLSRRLDPGSNVEVGFADGYPLLVLSEESLADLNSRLALPVPMDRFRPNIVVSGCERPFEEDEWHSFESNGIRFRGMKRCARCVIITTDQKTGERPGKEPLFTLAKYRRSGNNALFGMSANHLDNGVLRIGDAINVVRSELPPP